MDCKRILRFCGLCKKVSSTEEILDKYNERYNPSRTRDCAIGYISVFNMCAFVSIACTSFHGSRLGSGNKNVCALRKNGRSIVSAKLDALLFDCDGVLADTERDAHRVAFNMAFKERGLTDEWSETQYGVLLETGGGKERMTAYWNEKGQWPQEVGSDDDKKIDMVKMLHKRKTELFMELVEAGKVPLRPGVKRLIAEAKADGVCVAVCSTSNEKAVQKIVDQLGEDGEGIRVFAGDMVKKKKPAPDVYLMAKDELGLDVEKVCVVEDSFIGLKAARAAGMACIVTKSTYTKNEDFQEAQWVVESLEEPKVSLQALTEMVEGKDEDDDSNQVDVKFSRLRRRYGSSYL